MVRSWFFRFRLRFRSPSPAGLRALLRVRNDSPLVAKPHFLFRILVIITVLIAIVITVARFRCFP